MIKKLENIDEELKQKIIKISLKLDKATIIIHNKKKLCIPVSSDRIDNFLESFKEGIYSKIEYSSDLDFFSDYYNQISDYSKTENMLNEKNIKFFGNVKQRFEDGLFYIHINSSKYNGNASDKDLWKALILAFYDALYE